MKQEKSALQKPKNIGYRIVMALMALCVPIVAYFNDLVYMVWDSEAFKFLAQLQGNTTDNGQTEQALSIRYAVEQLLPNLKGGESKIDVWATLAPIKAELIATLVCFALAILAALAVFFISCFVRNRVVGTSVAGVGLLSMISMSISFHYLAKALLAGKVSLASFFATSALTQGLLNQLMKLSIFQLSTGYYLILFLFIAMVLWGVANWMVSLGEKEKSEKSK